MNFWKNLAARFVKRSASLHWIGWGDSSADPAQLSEPMKQSAWVMRAIKKISGPIAAVDFYLYEGEREFDLPGLDEFMSQPVEGMTWPDFIEASVGWLKLEGECFWIIGEPVPFPERQGGIQQIRFAEPSKMQHVTEDGKIVGWKYNNYPGRFEVFTAEEVVQIKYWNPYDPYRGLSEYLAAKLAAESDWLAAKFNKNLTSNNGDTGPFIVAKGGVPSDAQRQQIINQLREKRAAQSRGEFRPAFLTGDIEIKDPLIKAVDANFSEARVANRHEIAIAFGIPPSMFDVKAAYSIGSNSDYYQLIIDVCIPTGKKLEAGLSYMFSRMLKRNITVMYDWDDHPVMQEVRRERMASIDVLWSKGVPLDDISDYLNLELPAAPTTDKGFMPFSLTPAEDLLLPDDDERYSEEEETEEEEPDAEEEEETAEKNPIAEAFRQRAIKAEAARAALWRSHMEKRRPSVKAVESKVTKELMNMRSEVLANLNAKMVRAMTRGFNPVDFLFDKAAALLRFVKSLRAVRSVVLLTAVDQAKEEIGQQDDPWKYPDPNKFLDARDNETVTLTDAIYGRVSRSLQEGLDANESLDQLTARVKDEFRDLEKYEARRIATTETSVAYSQARQETFAALGVERKQWLTSRGPRVRDSHQEMEGVTILNAAKFQVRNRTGGTDAMDGPSDPSGSPENVINCQCVSVPTTEELT